jgi:hypothetical protein
MYNGTGGDLGWNLTGGTSTLNEWSHVVATWNGSAAQLYVNGALADATNEPLNGVYNANTSAASPNFIVAATDSGSPYAGSVDEVAFYGSALTAAQVLAHYNAIATDGYHSVVRADGALLQLSNNGIPEPSGITLVGVVGAGVLVRRRQARR